MSSAVRLWRGLLIAGVFVARPAAAEPVVYSDTAMGYSIALPGSWEIIGGAELKLLTLASWVGGGRLGPNYEAGFREKGGTAAAPYILVQHHPPVANAERELPRVMTALAGSPEIQEVMQQSGFRLQNARWDGSRGRLYMSLLPTGSSSDDLRGLVMMMPSSAGIVQLNCYAPAAGFADALPLFEAIADSLAFEPNRPGTGLLGLWSGLNPILRHTLIGAAVGAVLGSLFDMVRRARA